MTMLGKMGHRITLATNGLEALKQWRQSEFDLIFMDVQMPEMTGLQATTEIRREDLSVSRTHCGHDRICDERGTGTLPGGRHG